MSINIRPLEEKDNIAIAKVIREVLREHEMNKPGTVFTDPTTDDLYSLFQTENSFYWVVEEEEKILGGCGIFPTKGLPNGCVELVKLYLHKDLRGHGIGKNLMDMCTAKAQQMGYSQLYLESMPELNSAVGLYKSLGYEILDKPLGESGHFACNLWMVKILD